MVADDRYRTPDTDLLIVGAGPAGLAAAIAARAAARAQGTTLRIDVIDKASDPGSHALSGAIVDPEPLRLLGGGDRLLSDAITVPRLRLVALRPQTAHVVPSACVPRFLTGGGCFVHLPTLVRSLTALAAERGVQVHSGLAVQGLAYHQGRVTGVHIGEGNPQRRQTVRGVCEQITARQVLIADGANGVCSAAARLQAGLAPQVWSLGIKWLLHDRCADRPSCDHLFGWPLPPTQCGGGFCYRPGDGLAHVGLVVPLSRHAPQRDPVAYWEQLQAHPYIQARCRSPILCAGARLLPEGGSISMGPLCVPGALLAGDAAGLVDARRQRGVELALLSGMAAGRTAVLSAHTAVDTMERTYRRLLGQMGVMRHLRRGRNFRQVFDVPAGMLLSPVQELLPVQLPHRTQRTRNRGRPDRRRSKDVLSQWSRGRYPRHVLPHVGLNDPSQCLTCAHRWGQPCISTCPAGVFAPRRDGHIGIAHDNCVHCRSCAAICPQGVVDWTVPAEGSGPRLC